MVRGNNELALRRELLLRLVELSRGESVAAGEPLDERRSESIAFFTLRRGHKPGACQSCEVTPDLTSPGDEEGVKVSILRVVAEDAAKALDRRRFAVLTGTAVE